MKKIQLLLALLAITTLGFSQTSEVDAYDVFQGKLQNFKTLIEQNSQLISAEGDKEIRKQYADEIREMGNELKDELEDLAECTNPNYGYNLAMASIFSEINPGLGAYYLVEAITGTECPGFVNTYNRMLDDITYTAWKVKLTSKPSKIEGLTTELLELKNELASL